METHSSILAWRIPWTEEPGGLQSMGSQRVRHNWVTYAHTYNQARTWEIRLRFKLIVKTVCLYIRHFEIRITVNAINTNAHWYSWFVLVIQIPWATQLSEIQFWLYPKQNNIYFSSDEHSSCLPGKFSIY